MRTPTIQRVALAGAWMPATANPEAREVDVIFLSGAEIEREDPYTGRRFFLTFDPAGANLTRMNSGVAPILDSHADRPLENQLGIVLKAWRVGDQFMARLRFSERAAVQPIWADIMAGTMRGISGGFNVSEYEEETDSKGNLIRMIARRWEPVELSVVSVPADRGAVVLSMKQETIGDQSMTTQQQTGSAAPAPAHERINQILAAANLGAEFNVRLLATNPTPEQAGAACLEEMARRGSQNETRIGTPAATITRDYGDTVRASMTEALMARLSGKAPAEIGRQWHGRRVADMARECLASRGVRTFGSDSQIISEALMHSTSDFPNLLGNVANKTLLAAYTAAESDLKKAFRRSTANDFKSKYLVRRGEFPALEEVPEGGEFKFGTIGEARESLTLATYGKIFSISRQALINDDLGAFSDMTVSIGAACADFEANQLVALITSNAGVGPTMSDGQPFFDNAAHGNSGSGAIGVQSLDAARTAMRTQRGIDGSTIVDARPRFLIVPAAKETTAQQVLTVIAAVDPEKVNPFAGKLELVVEPRLDAIDDARWYLWSDPAVLPAGEFAYLAGAEGPTIEQQAGFEIDGLKIKARLDFGAAMIDWRAAFVSTGS